MRAIILAAGRGSRMKDMTEDKPKCLVSLLGRSLLDWQIEALRAAGIGQIAVVSGYRADMLKQTALTIFENPRWAETNMIVSLTCADEWLRAYPCVVAYADLVYHTSIVRALMQAEDDFTFTYDRAWRSLWSLRFANPLSDAESFNLDQNGFLLDIGRKPASFEQIQGQYMGLLRFTPAGWCKVHDFLHRLPPDRVDRMDVTTLIRSMLANGLSIRPVPVTGHWCEVDNENDLQIYEKCTRESRDWSHDWR